MTLPKPAYGEACNNCGQCCMRYPCPFAQKMFDQLIGCCPALEQDGDRFVCGLVVNPQRYNPLRTALHGVEKMRKAALVLIGHGTGCDAIFVGERKNEAYRNARIKEAQMDPNRPPSAKFIAAIHAWGGILLRREKC